MDICYNGVWGTACADNGWDEVDANVICQQLGFSYQRAFLTNNGHFGAEVLLENITCNQNHSKLSQCMDFVSIGGCHHCKDTAGVICKDELMMSTSTEQVQTTTVRATTTNTSLISTYTSQDTMSTASIGSGSSILLIIYGTTLVALLIIVAVAIVIIVVVIMRKRVGQIENR